MCECECVCVCVMVTVIIHGGGAGGVPEPSATQYTVITPGVSAELPRTPWGMCVSLALRILCFRMLNF